MVPNTDYHTLCTFFTDTDDSYNVIRRGLIKLKMELSDVEKGKQEREEYKKVGSLIN